ncbi:MAG: metal-binding protein [Planctomyces sp.]|nr:metal-binding protein [Planctomyces sp.]
MSAPHRPEVRQAAPPRLRVRGVTLGPFATNAYLLWLERPGESGPAESWIIDAPFEGHTLVEAARSLGLRPTRLILTHTHADHIAGVPAVRAAFPGVRVAVHPAERAWLNDPVANLSGAHGAPLRVGDADETLGHGDMLRLGQTAEQAGVAVRVLHTPGHSPGSVSLYCPGLSADDAGNAGRGGDGGEPGRGAAGDGGGVVISGDVLFAGSVGRTDFPGCDVAALVRSIRETLYRLPGSTRVLPGHGPATTIEREMRTNPFVPALAGTPRGDA